MCLVLSKGRFNVCSREAESMFVAAAWTLDGPWSQCLGQACFTAQPPLGQRSRVTQWRSVSGGGHCSRFRLGQRCGRTGDHYEKGLFGAPRGLALWWRVLCPPGPWVDLPRGSSWWPPSPLPHVPLALATSHPPFSSVRGVVPPRTDHCQDWHMKASSLVHKAPAFRGIVVFTQLSPGRPREGLWFAWGHPGSGRTRKGLLLLFPSSFFFSPTSSNTCLICLQLSVARRPSSLHILTSLHVPCHHSPALWHSRDQLSCRQLGKWEQRQEAASPPRPLISF